MKVFHLPDLGEGLPEAEIHEWFVKEGDAVEVDQPLAAMETAKAVVEVPTPFTGVIKKLHGKPGDVIQTGQPLVTFESDGKNEDAGAVVDKIATHSTAVTEEIMLIGDTDLIALPAARAMARNLGLELTTIKGTGPKGVITEADVRAAMSTEVTGERLTSTKRMMAQSMSRAHQEVVPASLMDDADITHWQKADVTWRLMRAVIAACRIEPSLNSHYHAKHNRQQIFDDINLGIAVDTPKGLFVPVVHQAQTKSADELRERLNQFKQKAINHHFDQDDLKNATITLSNFGSIGCKYANAVVVPPTVAIIAVGRSFESATVRDGKTLLRRLMPLSITFDHRVITGGQGARFLQALIADLQK